MKRSSGACLAKEPFTAAIFSFTKSAMHYSIHYSTVLSNVALVSEVTETVPFFGRFNSIFSYGCISRNPPNKGKGSRRDTQIEKVAVLRTGL